MVCSHAFSLRLGSSSSQAPLAAPYPGASCFTPGRGEPEVKRPPAGGLEALGFELTGDLPHSDREDLEVK